jgi:hypothetical protein
MKQVVYTAIDPDWNPFQLFPTQQEIRKRQEQKGPLKAVEAVDDVPVSDLAEIKEMALYSDEADHYSCDLPTLEEIERHERELAQIKAAMIMMYEKISIANDDVLQYSSNDPSTRA